MKRKRFWLLCSFICISLVTVGCGGSNDKKEEVYYADTDFVASMQTGLQERWDLAETSDAATGSEEEKESMLSFIQVELDQVEKYKDEKFKDSKLQEIALQYINLLNDAKESCKYITVDYDKFLNEWTPIYNERTKLIIQLMDDYNLEFDKKHDSSVKDFSTNAQLVIQEEDNKKAIQEMVDKIQFEVESESYGYKTYKALIDNTTNIDFQYFSLTINLIDAEGVIVSTTYSSVNNLNKGSKAYLDFLTDVEFTSMEITYDWY